MTRIHFRVPVNLLRRQVTHYLITEKVQRDSILVPPAPSTTKYFRVKILRSVKVVTGYRQMKELSYTLHIKLTRHSRG